MKLFDEAIPINNPAIIGKKIKNDSIPPGINYHLNLNKLSTGLILLINRQ